jgi:hypothetical protein
LLSICIVRIGNFLSAHRTIFATALDKLDDTELMEDMIALELTASDHLVLANSTIFETINGFCLFLGSLNILDLHLSLSILRNNIPD